jgi:hypothetical protein
MVVTNILTTIITTICNNDDAASCNFTQSLCQFLYVFLEKNKTGRDFGDNFITVWGDTLADDDDDTIHKFISIW